MVATLPLLTVAPASGPSDQDLMEIKAALEKCQGPYAAVHDLYLSTMGCIVYPEEGAEGEMQYPAGGMGVHFLNVSLMDGALYGPSADEEMTAHCGSGYVDRRRARQLHRG